VDQNFNRDISDLFSDLAGRDVSGLNRWVEKKAQMVMPYSALMKQLNKQLQGELQLDEGIFQRAMAMVPGHTGTPYYDVWGRKSEVPNDSAWDGFRNNTGLGYKNNDPEVNSLVDRLDHDRVMFTGPSRNHDGAILKLDEYMELRRLFGSEIKGEHGKTLVGELKDLLDSPEYKMASPGKGGSRQTLVSGLVGQFKEAAFGMLIDQRTPDGLPKHQAFIDDWTMKRTNKYEQDPSKLLLVGP
jgi:hypothetical protein